MCARNCSTGKVIMKVTLFEAERMSDHPNTLQDDVEHTHGNHLITLQQNRSYSESQNWPEIGIYREKSEQYCST